VIVVQVVMACCTGRQPHFYHTDHTQQYAALRCSQSDDDDLLMYDNDYDDDDDDDDDGGRMKSGLMLTLTDADPVALVDKSVPCVLSSSCDYSAYTWPLLNDCMWSAGMLPPDLKAATPPPARAVRQHELTMAAIEDAFDDVDTDTVAVDPSLISPCPHVTSSPPGARHVIDPGIYLFAWRCDRPVLIGLSVCPSLSLSVRLSRTGFCSKTENPRKPKICSNVLLYFRKFY